MSSNLFAQAAQAANVDNAGRLLVAFRAGKMTVSSGNRVTADPRRGKIEVRQGTDQLMHFQWRDRQTGDIVDDLIVFPDEAHLRKLKQVKDGRVLLLEFTGSERRLFFWMQEPSDERDAEFVTKVNEMLNNPPAPGEGDDEGGLGGDLPADLSQLPPHLLQQLQAMGPGGMQQAQQLIQMLNAQRQAQGGGGAGGGSSPGTATVTTPPQQAAQPKTPTPAPATSTPGPTSTQLADILSGLTGGSPAAQDEPQSLARVMNADSLLPLLTADESVARQLLQFLPEGQQTMEELRALPHSGQWQRFLDSFGEALQSGQLVAVTSELGLELSATPTLEEFFAELEKKGGMSD